MKILIIPDLQKKKYMYMMKKSRSRMRGWEAKK